MTWMIEAHSAFPSMSPTAARWTLRILPRIGSSAWNSLLRASLAVPRAESPSTMNSSVRSTSSLRQSASFAGRDDDSSAFLRRCASLVARAANRVFEAAATFSSNARAYCLSPRFVLMRNAFSSRPTTSATTFDAAGVPRTSFVSTLELRLGHAHGHNRGKPFEDVFLDNRVVVDLEQLRPRNCSFMTLTSARSKPATCVPPLGVAMMFTNDLAMVS